MDDLFDVVAVNIKDSRVRLIAEAEHERDAEAVVKFAVIRRGVVDEYFVTVPAGRFKDGDEYHA